MTNFYQLNSLKLILILSSIILNSSLSYGQTPQYSMSSGSVANSIPLRSASSNQRDGLYYPSDFGTPPAGFITTVYLNSSAAVTANLSGFVIKMGSTSLTAFTTGSWITPLDTVFKCHR